MQVSKWGNSLAIRLPAAVVEVANARTLRVERADAGDAQALARLRKLRGTMPADFRFDRMEANERS